MVNYIQLLRNFASTVAISKALIYASMVDHEIIYCLAYFHDIAPSPKVTT